MGRKRLITDSYPVVKRREGSAGHSKGELAPELGEEPLPLSVDEAELELLRQFDLAWQYGPCTGLSPFHSYRDHTVAALASGRADGPKASPRSASGAAEPPRGSPLPVQPLAFLPPLTRHRRPPACYLRTGHKPEPVAAPRLSSAVENIWQKRGSQGRKEAESGGLTSRVPGPSLRINTAEARCPLHGEWSLRTRAWP
ncbi:DNA polymerase delta subunit 4 isoform X1 [Odocoileus virginianus]|uniref:DNA polymerase delta subunit 4 isoform X1 n=1 Tax=Odocoileus virginianus TaxID=9874 RepID=A0ABM4HE28_ODOVR